MLVLTKKKGEELTLGEVTVRVLGYRNGHVRLGIEAPDDVALGKDKPAPRKRAAAAEAAAEE